MSDEGVESVAERGAISVWAIETSTQIGLAERVAVVLEEHMRDDDQLNVSYAVTQVGSSEAMQNHLLGRPTSHTELYFEYSALVILRRSARA